MSKFSLILLIILNINPLYAKTLFLSHYNGQGADADYALGSKKAASVTSYKVAKTKAEEGKWGGGLELGKQNGRCIYEGLNNFNPGKGTIDFWCYLYEGDPKLYRPLIGCYYPKKGQEKKNAIELYAKNDRLRLSIYTSLTEVTGGGWSKVKVGVTPDKWHHIVINWDCTKGDKNSQYNVYLNGENVIHVINQYALKGTGRKLHVGVWDYAYGIALDGRIDELRVTDQIEHPANFTPPKKEYHTPGTVEARTEVYSNIKKHRSELVEVIKDLKDAVKLTHKHIDTSHVAEIIKSGEFIIEKAARIKNDGGARQEELDLLDDAIKSEHQKIVTSFVDVYDKVLDVYNRTVVDLGYLKDELDGLKRGILSCKKITSTQRAVEVSVQCDKTIKDTLKVMSAISDDFFRMFAPTANLVVPLLADIDNLRLMKNFTKKTLYANTRIEKGRALIAEELDRLKNTSDFKKNFPLYRKYIPAELPPVEVAPNGELKRFIISVGDKRLRPLVPLGFDLYDAPDREFEWVKKDEFKGDPAKNSRLLEQWAKHKIRSSTTLMHYALGDGMYKPPWFHEFCAGNLDYYIKAMKTYTKTGCYEYRHPAVREMITTYLENFASYSGGKPYTFIYKGPWEAHPYGGGGASIPGKRVRALIEHGFSKYAIKAFRGYLKSKFRTIEKLNEAWRSSYKDFEDIQPPEPMVIAYVIEKDESGVGTLIYSPFQPNKRLPATPLTYEFERCRKDLYSEYLADCYKAVRRGDPVHPLASSTSGGIMDESLVRSIDDLQMAENCVDMWGKHPSGSLGWYDAPYMAGLNRYFNKSLVSLEYYGWMHEKLDTMTTKYTSRMPKGLTLDDVYNCARRSFWHDLSYGRKYITVYLTSGLIELKGKQWKTWDKVPLLRPFAGFFPPLKRRILNVNDILVNIPIMKPKVGLLHPGVSIINAYPADSCGNYVGADIMESLLSKQYNFGIVPEKFILNGRDSLENYEVMILPYVQYCDDGFAEKLLSWVKRGGTLISLAPFGLFDKYGFAIEDGSKKVFPQTKFAIETPEKNTLSWQWHMTRDGKVVDKEYILKDYGKGIVLTILNGRALMRTEDEVAQGHESAEWGLAEKNVAAGHNSKEWGLEANDAKANKDKKAPPTWRTVRPRGSNVDVSLTAAQKVFYDVLAKSTKRKAYTKSGNIEMIVYQKEPDEPLYLSLLNWDSYHSHEPRMVVRGQYNNITDLSVADGFPIPAEIKDGVTTFPIILGPGEGLLLKLEHSNENNLN